MSLTSTIYKIIWLAVFHLSIPDNYSSCAFYAALYYTGRLSPHKIWLSNPVDRDKAFRFRIVDFEQINVSQPPPENNLTHEYRHVSNSTARERRKFNCFHGRKDAWIRQMRCPLGTAAPISDLSPGIVLSNYQYQLFSKPECSGWPTGIWSFQTAGRGSRELKSSSVTGAFDVIRVSISGTGILNLLQKKTFDVCFCPFFSVCCVRLIEKFADFHVVTPSLSSYNLFKNLIW